MHLSCDIFIIVIMTCRSLLQDTDRPRTEKVDLLEKNENRPPHHDNLYRLVSMHVCYMKKTVWMYLVIIFILVSANGHRGSFASDSPPSNLHGFPTAAHWGKPCSPTLFYMEDLILYQFRIFLEVQLVAPQVLLAIAGEEHPDSNRPSLLASQSQRISSNVWRRK